MSRTIQFLTLRILAAAALSGSSLMLPATAEAQTGSPERALLNYTVAAPQVPGFSAFWAPAAGNAATGIEEAERALLGRTTADDRAMSYRKLISVASQLTGPSANGEQALLGRQTGE